MQLVRKVFALVNTLLFIVFSGHAQPGFDFTRPPDVISPSPAASALFKDVNVPVNYYTGTPEINIPLYTIKAGRLQMPIGLQYNAGGIRVEQDAGLVGLGWDMITGGAIGRSIVGQADEAGIGPGGSGYRISARNLHMPDPGHDDSLSIWINNLTACNYYDLSLGKLDLCPDNYFMHFNGNSARLFFDKNARPYFSPYKPWKLTGNEGGFTVIIEDGTTYEFKLAETSQDQIETLPNDNIHMSQANTSWYLTRVISADKTDTIVLNYTPVSYSATPYNPTETYAVMQRGQQPVLCAPIPSNTFYNYTTDTKSISGYMLSDIQTSDEHVYFYASTGRQDNSSGLPYKLDSIVAYSTQPSSGSGPLLKYVFNYDYYNPAGDVFTKRLRLLSVSKLGSANEKGEVYQFGYNGNNNLPSKDSKAQDSWGFYNGATSNTTLIPAFVDNWGQPQAGANRNTDSTAASMGLLTQIQYPTGGTTNFEYEANRYPTNLEGGRDSVIASAQAFASTGSVDDPQPTFDSATFTLAFDQYVTVITTAKYNQINVGDVQIYINSGTYTGTISPVWAGGALGINVSAIVFLKAGTYTACVQKTTLPQETGQITVHYTYRAPYGYVGLPVGGARIRRLIQSDGTTQTVKKFLYLQDSITSSGVLLTTPIYSDIQYFPMIANCSDFPGKVGDWKYFTQHSVSTVELGRTQGSHIGYSKVTVLNGDNGENGKEEYFFSFVPDATGDSYPYAPRSSLDDFRGQLIRKNVYSASGKLLEKEENHYNFSNQIGYPNFKQIYGFKVGARKQGIGFDANGCPLTYGSFNFQFDYNLYSVFQLWPSLASTKKTTYSSQSPDSIVTLVNIGYDTVNLRTAVNKTWNSKGDSLTDYYSYPKNFAGTAVYDSMVARNIIVPPIESTHYYNTLLKTKERTNYQLWPVGSIQAALPANRQLQYSSNPIETRLLYLGYDNSGNLLSQQKASDAIHSYIWDYHKLYPIAEAINADTGNIAYTSFEADGTGNWTIGAGTLSPTGGITGNKFYTLASGATISKSGLSAAINYLVTYWSKNGPLTISGTTAVTGLTKKGWTFYQHSLPAGSTAVTISGAGGILDELRLYPANAQMNTVTYTPLIGQSAVCSANNTITYYEYDGLDRLLRIRDMDSNIVKQYDYQYQQPAVFVSAPQSVTYTRNNCATGGSPSSITYTTAAGAYQSAISQAIADSLALNSITANGQNNANATCTCTFYNAILSQNYSRSCAVGGTVSPSSITYTVPAGTYSSLISQADADSKAQADKTANGQNYANAHSTCTYYNAVLSQNYTRTCSCGFTGSSVAYTVAAGAYSSLISQADADSKAQTDQTANGQNYANTNGTCTQTLPCSGNNHKIINCVCQTGTLQIVSQTNINGKCNTVYGYFFTDGTYNYDHTTIQNSPCQF
jgi:YD repeat-containing protein